MKSLRILIVSNRPLLREGLKCLVEEAGLPTVTTVADEKNAESIADEFAPDVVVIDRLDTGIDDPVYFLQW